MADPRAGRRRKDVGGPPTSLSPPVTNTIPASTVLDYQSPSAKRMEKKRKEDEEKEGVGGEMRRRRRKQESGGGGGRRGKDVELDEKVAC